MALQLNRKFVSIRYAQPGAVLRCDPPFDPQEHSKSRHSKNDIQLRREELEVSDRSRPKPRYGPTIARLSWAPGRSHVAFLNMRGNRSRSSVTHRNLQAVRLMREYRPCGSERPSVSRRFLLASALFCGLTGSSNAQERGTPSVLPRPDFHFPGNVGRTYSNSLHSEIRTIRLRQADPLILIVLHRVVGADRLLPFGDQTPVGDNGGQRRSKHLWVL